MEQWYGTVGTVQKKLWWNLSLIFFLFSQKEKRPYYQVRVRYGNRKSRIIRTYIKTSRNSNHTYVGTKKYNTYVRTYVYVYIFKRLTRSNVDLTPVKNETTRVVHFINGAHSFEGKIPNLIDENTYVGQKKSKVQWRYAIKITPLRFHTRMIITSYIELWLLYGFCL